MARLTRQTLHDADPTFMWKLVLRALTIIFAIIAIALIAWAQSHPIYRNNYSGGEYDGYGLDNGDYEDEYVQQDTDTYLLSWEYIPLGLSIAWNLANIGVWFTPSRSGRGMHPGANVGCDLVLWLALIVTGIFASFAATYYIDTLEFGTDSPLIHKGIVIAVGVAFTFIVMLCHFALFISACRYTHARRYQRGGRYAKAVTDEATVLASKMVREMGFAPPQPLHAGGPVPMYAGQGQMVAPTAAASSSHRMYSDDLPDRNPQHDISGNGKGKETDLEQGRGSTGAQPYPDLIIESPGGRGHSLRDSSTLGS